MTTNQKANRVFSTQKIADGLKTKKGGITMKKTLATLMAVIMIIAMLPVTAMAMPTVHPVVRTGVTRITFPSLEVVEVVSFRTGTANPIVEGVSVNERLGIPNNRRTAGEWNDIRTFVGRTSTFNIANNGIRLELVGEDRFIEHVQLVGTGAPGTQNNPLHWNAIQNRIEDLEGGHRFANRVRNDYTDVWVVVEGDRHGVVEFSNTVMSGDFERVTLARGETRIIRMHGASLWLQQQPIVVTNFVFRTGGARQADAQRFGWVWAPDIPIEFVVPADQGINVIQAFDPRVGEVREFRPGQTAYIGREGATFWFHNPRQASNYNTSFIKNGVLVYS